MVVIALECPPGGGKGFLLKHLAQHGLGDTRVSVYLQDDSIDHVMDYLTDPERWILTKELHFLIRHVLAMRNATGVVFTEGSPYTDYRCYFADAKKHPLEDNLYKDWYNFLTPMWNVDMHVFLVESPHQHLERIIGNSKKEQGNTSILSIYKHINLYQTHMRTSQHLICHPNFEDNEPAMEIMKKQLIEIVQMLKNNSLYRIRLNSLCLLPSDDFPTSIQNF